MALTSSMILSSVFFMINMSPLMLVISILIFSSMTMTAKWIESSNPWIPLIFTLAFLGGMMIIFMYIVSISKTKTSKNKNKQPILFVFVPLALWGLKYGNESNMVHIVLSSFFTQYMLLCFLIMLILFISAKMINSPFKALKGAF